MGAGPSEADDLFKAGKPDSIRARGTTQFLTQEAGYMPAVFLVRITHNVPCSKGRVHICPILRTVMLQVNLPARLRLVCNSPQRGRTGAQMRQLATMEANRINPEPRS